MTRDRLVQAGVQAILDRYRPEPDADEQLREAVGDVVDAVEPLIRADEREQVMVRVKRDMSVDREKWTVLEQSASAHQTMADLRAQVEDLSAVLIPGSTILWLNRDDVLALIDGGADG